MWWVRTVLVVARQRPEPEPHSNHKVDARIDRQWRLYADQIKTHSTHVQIGRKITRSETETPTWRETRASSLHDCVGTTKAQDKSTQARNEATRPQKHTIYGKLSTHFHVTYHACPCNADLTPHRQPDRFYTCALHMGGPSPRIHHDVPALELG